jgi:hypothetical protein
LWGCLLQSWCGHKHEISSLKGTELIRFITPPPPPPFPYFLPEDEIRTRFRNVVILIL